MITTVIIRKPKVFKLGSRWAMRTESEKKGNVWVEHVIGLSVPDLIERVKQAPHRYKVL